MIAGRKRQRFANALTEAAAGRPASAELRVSRLMSSRPSEDALIARFFAPYAGPAALGLRDDAALVRDHRPARTSC